MTRMLAPTVAVVGSINLDLVVALPERPKPGETVFGTDYTEAVGGKGANQAIGAARYVATSLIGTVGTDHVGTRMIETLESRSVNVEHLTKAPGQSGRALITVTPDGENSIVVLPLANSLTSAESVEAALTSSRPNVVVVQREIPGEAVVAASRWSISNGARLIVNASPSARIDLQSLRSADPVIVNEEEALDILGLARDEAVTLIDLVTRLAQLSISAVLTAGKQGAFVASGGVVEHVTATLVTPVDTTGAGDEFAGVLAARLALGDRLIVAAHTATDAAARLIQIPRSRR